MHPGEMCARVGRKRARAGLCTSICMRMLFSHALVCPFSSSMYAFYDGY